jgi:hypothetical protein
MRFGQGQPTAIALTERHLGLRRFRRALAMGPIEAITRPAPR